MKDDFATYGVSDTCESLLNHRDPSLIFFTNKAKGYQYLSALVDYDRVLISPNYSAYETIIFFLYDSLASIYISLMYKIDQCYSTGKHVRQFNRL